MKQQAVDLRKQSEINKINRKGEKIYEKMKAKAFKEDPAYKMYYGTTNPNKV